MRTSRPSRLGSARAAKSGAVRALASLVVVRATFATVLLAACGACSAPPVDWSDERTVPVPHAGVTLRADGTLAPDSLALLAASVAAPEPRCPGSLALARARNRLFAVWWTVQSDSSVRLLAARSDDGGLHWSAPAPIDTTDTGVAGCHRTPPSIAADSASGYVHVSYALRGREGPGLFFSHSMDAGGTFHEPVPIVYGDRLGRTSVAADGDRVVVAFEDPNSTVPRIGLALSRTMGHIFEQRLIPISNDNGIATHPLAAVHGRSIAVAWERRATTDSAPAALAVRAGTLH